MQRRRKHDIERYIEKIPVIVKLFDLLYVDGQSWLNKSYLERTTKLAKMVKKNKKVLLADKITTSDLGKINKFFKQMLKAGDEGIIVKSHDGVYQAGTRGWNWIKWKKDYVSEMVDNFDLVLIGAFYGKGRRSGSYGALLCAAYDQKEDQFFSVCKLGTGLTDENLEGLPKKMEKYVSDKKPARVTVKKEMEPDVWFEPEIVVEVLAAEVTKSPFHTAGYALRFPRFVNYRKDKDAEQATTVKEIKEMFEK